MKRKPHKKIYEPNLFYTLLRHYVDFTFRMAYSKQETYGLEKLPTDGAVIFAPNHTNALMDALAILSLNRKPKVFVARADIFKQKTLAKIFSFLKIMPISRIRDGRDSLRGSDETIRRSAEVLEAGVPFCILPEGTHRPMHSLLPLGKGIFRIAMLASEELGPNFPVYIVPVGLEYGNFFRYRSSLLIQLGDPINVTAYRMKHPQEEVPVVMNKMKDTLTEAMKEHILYIPDDEFYDATWELCNLRCNAQLRRMGLPRRILKYRWAANTATVQRVQQERAEHPETAAQWLKMANEFALLRKKKKISMASAANPTPLLSLLFRMLLLIAAAPYALVAGILSAPLKLTGAIICSKLKDAAFHNSVRYVSTLVLWPFILAIMEIIALCQFPFVFALAGFIAFVPSPVAFDLYIKWMRISISDAKWLFSNGLRNLKTQLLHQFGHTA